jgi:hypothetical protein
MTPLKYAVFGEADDDTDSDYDPEKDETKSVRVHFVCPATFLSTYDR